MTNKLPFSPELFFKWFKKFNIVLKCTYFIVYCSFLYSHIFIFPELCNKRRVKKKYYYLYICLFRDRSRALKHRISDNFFPNLLILSFYQINVIRIRPQIKEYLKNNDKTSCSYSITLLLYVVCIKVTVCWWNFFSPVVRTCSPDLKNIFH